MTTFMQNRFIFLFILLIIINSLQAQNTHPANKINFNGKWEFVKNVDSMEIAASLSGNTGHKILWEKVSLPHTPRIEPVEKKEEQWQGTCYYRKNFRVAAAVRGKHIALQFDAAMHEADIYLNGTHVYRHAGGYLPIYIDISDNVRFDGENIVVVKLNNQNNPAIPPGKSIKDLDFNYYGGIYRNAWLIIKDKLHIADAVEANRESGGGVMLHYENVSNSRATLMIKTELRNDYRRPQNAQVNLILTDEKGVEVGRVLSDVKNVISKGYVSFNGQVAIKNPALWSPEHPSLYQLTVQVLQQGKVVDEEQISTGVKTFRFEAGSFTLNGQPFFLRGTNRHQEYPYIGYALPDNAQFRDAYKIRAAGFNFVRCSHYPPSPAFLDACDRLGILVMNSIPGWQFFGNEEFQQNSYQNIRDLIHRDRNHASIILWEASLNETNMSMEYMQQSHDIVHKELPFTDVYTCGWMDDVYDVFIPARQHARAPDYWKKYTRKPILIAEYGDWEYYAQNAGFNQKEYKDLKEGERTSRQLREAGEKALLQQALNFQEAHNDNLTGTAVGDANWLLFDYKRGYAPDIESSGISDIFRLPKFSYYFYQSQYRTPENTNSDFGKPMIFIASYWNNPSVTTVRVFSNCDEAALLLNGKLIARQKPDQNSFSGKLPHPPFTFPVNKFEPGTLTAIGYNNGKEVISTTQRTPAKASSISMNVDTTGKPLQSGQSDIVFLYARITDENGVLVPDAKNVIQFTVTGNAVLIGSNPVKAEAGIATILLKAGDLTGKVVVTASSENLKEGTIKVTIK